MANEPEVIRQQMEETRTALAEKLETLENQVVETVHEATSAVSETVESVKDAVQETVDTVKDSVQDTVASVKETFDLRRQVDQHPWAMVGGSVAVGFVAGSLLPEARSAGSRQIASLGPSDGAPGFAPREPQKPGLFDRLTNALGAEYGKVKGLAIGVLMGLARDVVVDAIPPQMAPQVKELMNDLTTRMGGETFSGPILEERPRERNFTAGQEPERSSRARMGSLP
jgi:ElaB/YqjD/DUF883 family membrane-anchored ribosome-binding protein